MKILIIPDVHGRDFWIDPCSHIDEFDKVIFLGDYHDPYSFQVSQTKSRHQLRDKLVPFVAEHKDKVVCLMGNHDANYTIGEMSNRFDRYHKDEIRGYLQRMNLKLAHQEGNILFTHSGVLPLWLHVNELTLDDVLSGNVSDNALSQVSPRRGSWDHVGSCIWGDVDEYHNSEKLDGLYQIFGHTQMDSPVITPEFACLDCRKAFVLDTDDISSLKEF